MISRSRSVIIGFVTVLVLGLGTWYVLNARSGADQPSSLANLPEECQTATTASNTKAVAVGNELVRPPVAGPNADGLMLLLEYGGTDTPNFAQGLDNPIVVTVHNTTNGTVASRSSNVSHPTNRDAITYFEVTNSTGEKVADNLGGEERVLASVPTLAALSSETVRWDQTIGALSKTPSVAPLGTYTITFPNTEGQLAFTFSLSEAVARAAAPAVEAPTQADSSKLLPVGSSVQTFEGIEALRGTESNPAQLADTVVCPDGIRLAFVKPPTTEPSESALPVPTESLEVTPPRTVGPNADGLELSLRGHENGSYLPGEPVVMFLFNTTATAIPSRAEVAAGSSATSTDKIDYFVVLNKAGKTVATSAGDAIEVLPEPHVLAANGYIQGISWNQTVGTGESSAAPPGIYTIRFPNTAGPLEIEITITDQTH